MISGRPRPLASSSLGFIRRRDDDDNDVDGDDWNRRLATDTRISALQISVAPVPFGIALGLVLII